MQRVNEADLAYRGGDSGVKYLMRGPNLDWGVILLKPGENLAGHYHEQVEETFYVVQGQAAFEVNDEEIVAKAGTALRMEPKDRHAVRNVGADDLKLVFIKWPYLPKDKVSL
ncbi:MAG: cupin domain-containing protein [Anaerolineae bacterium]